MSIVRRGTERADVLVFSPPPFERNLEITGPVTVRLWIAFDSPDTDFTAKPIDVHRPNDINPNSGEPEGVMEQPRVARNWVFVDAAWPAHIVLPVIPPDP